MGVPFFSVCIPNYNYAQYLGTTIRSVLEQRFTDFEIVVVDNASTDESVEVVKSFDDPRLRLFQNRYNIGFAPNLQRASANARGRFMILLSSDDLMHAGALSRYHEVLEGQGVRKDQTVLSASTDMVGPDGALLKILHKPRGWLHPEWRDAEESARLELGGEERMGGHDVLREALTKSISVASFCATCYPRAMWEAVEGYDTTYQIYPDAAFVHKLLALDPDFIWVNERLFSYRVHPANQTGSAIRQAALKEQVDGYMRTFNYPAAVLDTLGIPREVIVRAYVKVSCADQSLAFLSRGWWTRAFKALTFGLATYPGALLKLPRTYAAAGLLALGPLGVWIAKVARRTFHGA